MGSGYNKINMLPEGHDVEMYLPKSKLGEFPIQIPSQIKLKMKMLLPLFQIFIPLSRDDKNLILVL